MSTLTPLVVLIRLLFYFFKDRFKLSAPRAHFLASRRIYPFHTRITLMFPSHMSRLTHAALPLCLPLFPPSSLLPSLLSDGVELTGAESFTMSGSKDKLFNTHAQVTYVFALLPHSFSSPTCSISPPAPLFLPSLPACFPRLHSALISPPSDLVSKMNSYSQRNCYLALARLN